MPLNARPKPPDPSVARDRLVEFFDRDWLMGAYARLNNNLNDLSRESGIARGRGNGAARARFAAPPD